MTEPAFDQRQRARDFLFILIGAAMALTQIAASPAASRGETRPPRSPPGEQWTKQFSATNQVSVLLGQDENSEEAGVRHLADVSRGGTSVQMLDGVSCRYLNRLNEGRMFGSLYFAISPSFKAQGLKRARVEIEYLGKKDTSFRLQFDGMDEGTHRPYLPVLPEGAKVMRFGTGADYGTIPTPGVWSVAVFHLTNTVFANAQRSGADFRLEVVPPEIYVRRVTVTREDAP